MDDGLLLFNWMMIYYVVDASYFLLVLRNFRL